MTHEDNHCGYSDEWQQYKNDYDKFEYDVRLHDGTEIFNCYPNGRKFNSIGGDTDGKAFEETQVSHIRFSERPILGINTEVSARQEWRMDAWVPIPETGLQFVDKVTDELHFAGDGNVGKNVLYEFKFPDGSTCEQVVYVEDHPSGPCWTELENPESIVFVVEDKATHVRLGKRPEIPDIKKTTIAGVKTYPIVDTYNKPRELTDTNPYSGKSGRGNVKAGSTARIVHQGGTLIKGKRTGRNEPCPCGSGNKFKKCCINK